ncbi:MAG: hypothetical protein R6V44_09605 [Paracoccaceae bacterium]
MPTGACRGGHDCKGGGAVLRPPKRDGRVFRSHGDRALHADPGGERLRGMSPTALRRARKSGEPAPPPLPAAGRARENDIVTSIAVTLPRCARKVNPK